MNAPTCPTCGRLLGAGDIGMGLCVRCGPSTWLWTEFDKHYHASEFADALARSKERSA